MSAQTEQRDNEISADAAHEVQRLQRSGYRGAALLRDPATGIMIVFGVADRGCACFALTAFTPEAGLDDNVVLLPLPGLRFDAGATQNEIFAAVEREIQRLASQEVGDRLN